MPTRFNREDVLKLVLVLESALLLVATVWALIAQIDVLTFLKDLNMGTVAAGLFLGVCTSSLSFALTVLTNRLSQSLPSIPSFQQFIRDKLYPIFAEVTPLDILLIAVASGFCEEVFFRGVLQQQFGLLIASVIFGLFHFVGRKFLIYMIWAGAAGLVLGIGFEFSHSLWVPILAHFANNLLSITLVRYRIGMRDL